MTSLDARSQLLRALELDLIGPSKGDDLEAEALPQSPSRWYLSGFLVPIDAGEEQRAEPTEGEEIDQAPANAGVDDAAPPEPAAARRAFFPSSIGVSVLVSAETKSLQAIVRWGDYRREAVPGAKPEDRPHTVWRRVQREAAVELMVPEATTSPRKVSVPDSDGLHLVLAVRPVRDSHAADGGLPDGTRSVSVFLVNERRPQSDETPDEAFAFQAELEVTSDQPLVLRPNLRGLGSADWDERVADLQYRDAYEYAVGHGVATEAIGTPDGRCRRVRTKWLPTAEVERVAPAEIPGVELSMEVLAGLADGGAAREAMGGLVTHYKEWIARQIEHIPRASKRRVECAEDLLRRAGIAAGRIAAGLALLDDPLVMEAFRIANRTMARASRQRAAIGQARRPQDVNPPRWRPFQLAFIVMSLPGIVEQGHGDRELVDLLFFPTGGGKTEAYLGLAAFTLVLRRLRDPSIGSAGLSVLMRYTLRLLTLDQLGRAATLMCALELEREADPAKLGEWPFEIGLWVGRAATPNRMGGKGDPDANCAYRKTFAFKNDDRKPAPIPLEECPWCGTKFSTGSFDLVPSSDRPENLVVRCVNRDCDFTRGRHLPILGVDEPIYRRLPCFLIATVDKFAAMPWTGEVGGFFGRVERHDKNGFYGPCHRGVGRALPGRLPPLDLVIQDELHLISGPMGTMVGLYESALDELSSVAVGGKKIRPKIVASTATVRRAEQQIRALFNRRVVEVFPPPGPNRRDSFFARVLPPSESNARLYLGIAAQGRSPKVVLLRTYLALLGAAQRAYAEAGGKRNKKNPADPYMTLLGYFNSLRELGGSRRIVEDEVRTRLGNYSSRRRVGEPIGLFGDREIEYDVVELTSRVSTAKVAEAKRRLSQPFHEKESVDVAIATNMISVGLDITRLGLMVVLGQPKTSAEYIQATSRVGRDPERPGLVVTLLNVHKARDRSHYERFAAYHGSFYRSVEATSVTPFSPRALDRGLAGTLVALARQGHLPMTSPEGATEILSERARLDFVVDCLGERAASQASGTPAEKEALRLRVRERAKDLLDDWCSIAKDYHESGVRLQYQTEIGAAQRLLYEFLNPELKNLPARNHKFRANRSMRDVEPSVNLWLRTPEGVEIEEDDEA